MTAKIISLSEAKKQKADQDLGQKSGENLGQNLGGVSQMTSKTSCPQCGSKAVKPHTPFCSRRCAQLDLGKWLNEDYRIPAHEAMDDSDIDALITQLETDDR